MKKILVCGLAIAVLLGGAITSMVGAETDSSNLNKVSSDTGNQPMVLEINNSGHVLLRGKIDSVASNSLTIKSWGGNWTINISSSTKLQPNDITKFQSGDFVGVQGAINQNASWSVNATLVRDWTAEQRVKQSAQQAKETTQQLIKSLIPKNWQGTASGVNTSGNSLTLTIDSTVYTVSLAAGAQLVNKNWGVITLANVNNGDMVRVWGPASSTTITASILRDISIPIQSGKKND